MERCWSWASWGCPDEVVVVDAVEVLVMSALLAAPEDLAPVDVLEEDVVLFAVSVCR